MAYKSGTKETDPELFGLGLKNYISLIKKFISYKLIVHMSAIRNSLK